ncbi:MAG: hypothetical protein ACRD1U_08080 [Vicinamibacterales bacterium]
MLVTCAIVVAGCARSGDSPPVSVVDLLHEFERAEQRPPASFTRTSIVAAGLVRPSMVAPAHSRATWDLPLPRHGMLRAFLAVDPAAPPAAAVRFRVGVSDHRIYEALAHRIVHPANGWVEFHADLSAYAGFKWSLFYRPDRTIWRLVLATDPAAGGGAPGVWGSPEIVTDRRSAREYVARRHGH